jgi:hypothetical protein
MLPAMTTTELDDTEIGTSTNRTGLYLAILQLVFTLGWTTYVIYLPKLAADVGIAPSAVILILMVDQAIFTITDTVMGAAADKIAPFVGLLTAVSCAAFVALPFVAGVGRNAQIWLIALIVVWSITSSALRAPPLTLLGNHCAKPRIPFLSALAMLGYGVAGAVSPYLGVVLVKQDARLPFVLSSVVLLITALALSQVERGVAEPAPARRAAPAKPLGAVPVIFIAAMVILSLGYQLHFSINSAPFYLRFAKPDDLQWLMPVFWIGFNIAIFSGERRCKTPRRVDRDGRGGALGRAGDPRRGGRWRPQYLDRDAIHRGCGLGLHADERDLGGACDRRQRRRRQGHGARVFGAGAGDVCTDGGGSRRIAEAARIRAAVALAPVACWSVAGCGLLVIAAARVQQRMQRMRSV